MAKKNLFKTTSKVVGGLAMVLAMVFALVLVGCGDGAGNTENNGENGGGKTLVSLAINPYPTKTVYTVNETLNTAGMSVRASYTDGSSEVITDYTMQLDGAAISNGGTLTQTGEKALTAHKGDISSAGVSITVNPARETITKNSFTGTWGSMTGAQKVVISSVTDTGATLVYTERGSYLIGVSEYSVTLTLTWGASGTFPDGNWNYEGFDITGSCSSGVDPIPNGATSGRQIFGLHGNTLASNAGIGIHQEFEDGRLIKILGIWGGSGFMSIGALRD